MDPTIPASDIVSVHQAPTGVPLIIAGTCDDPVVARRLTSLGWRPGAQARVVRKASGGARVLDVLGGRIAVSRALARSLCVEAV